MSFWHSLNASVGKDIHNEAYLARAWNCACICEWTYTYHFLFVIHIACIYQTDVPSIPKLPVIMLLDFYELFDECCVGSHSESCGCKHTVFSDARDGRVLSLDLLHKYSEEKKTNIDLAKQVLWPQSFWKTFQIAFNECSWVGDDSNRGRVEIESVKTEMDAQTHRQTSKRNQKWQHVSTERNLHLDGDPPGCDSVVNTILREVLSKVFTSRMDIYVCSFPGVRLNFPLCLPSLSVSLTFSSSSSNLPVYLRENTNDLYATIIAPSCHHLISCTGRTLGWIMLEAIYHCN